MMDETAAILRDLAQRTSDARTAAACAAGADALALGQLLDACRGLVCVVCVAVTFGVLPLWLSVHALVDVWRKFGRGPTAIAHVGLACALCAQFFVPATRVHVMNAFGGDLGFPSRVPLLASFILALLSLLLKAGPCTLTLGPSQLKRCQPPCP